MGFNLQEALPDLNVSRETMDRLGAYVHLLEKWQQRVNLVADSTLPHIWTRHILDSAQLTTAVPNWNACSWLDLGSGAGFPGMVIAILRGSDSPPIHLIESDRKKALFLTEVARQTETSVVVLNQRIETVGHMEVEIVSARACARLVNLLEWAEGFLAPQGLCIFPKGQDVEGELTEAHKCWRMQVEILPSITHDQGKILRIGDLQRV